MSSTLKLSVFKATISKPPVVLLMGPTASGKTALACEWYKRGDVELISVDSALIYRDMNIGTAKPSAQELLEFPHALINILNPTESYSVGQFLTDVKQHIERIHHQQKIPVLVGGTMLYFKALLEGIAELPVSDLTVRTTIEQEAALSGWQHIYEQLQQVDPITAARFLPTDRQRITRALEVYRLSGRPLSDWHAEQQPTTSPYHFKLFAMLPERPVLHERIALRLQQMWAAGLIDEVQALRQQYDLQPDLPSMRAVGYRQVWDYLDRLNSANPMPISELHDLALFATRQLAKRQTTWLRSLQTRHDITIYTHMLQNPSKLTLNLNPR